MKKIILFFILTSLFVAGYSQDTTQARQLNQLLNSYYAIRDGLVAGNSTTTSLQALEFIKVANTIDYKLISEGNINALLKDATIMSETKDLKKQRTHFANLSNNMLILAKSVSLSKEPVYQAYCPMKKASWLTNEKVIKNPYYGSAMLSCGEIKETFSAHDHDH